MKLEKLINFIKKNPDNDAKVKPKLLEFALSSDPMNLRNFFVRCDKVDFFGNEIAYSTINALIENGRDDIVSAMFETAKENVLHYGIYQIGQALADFKKFNLDDGIKRLREGLYHSTKNFDHVIADMEILAKNAFLLEGVNLPAAEAYPKPSFEIAHNAPFHESPYTCCVICDPVYFNIYADSFVKGLRERCGSVNIFAILVNADDEIASKCAAYDGITVARVSCEGKLIREFCDSARFAMAGDILHATGVPTIFMDIRSTLPSGIAEVMSETAKNPISICDTGNKFPSRRISTAIIGSQPTDESFAFWDTAGDFVLKGLARKGPLSELGGVSLYVAACRGKEAGWDIEDMNGDGAALTDLFALKDENKPDGGCLLSTGDGLYILKSVSSKGRVTFESRDETASQTHIMTQEKKPEILRSAFNDKAKLFDFLKKNRQQDKQWEAILNFAQRVDILSLHKFFKQSQWEGFSAPNIAYSTVFGLAGADNDDIVASLLATSNEANPLYGIFNIGQSFIECKNHEVERCGHYLREGLYHCLKNDTVFSDFGFAIQNAYLMESVEWPTPERAPEPTFEIIHRDTFESSPYIIMLFGSPEYFNIYWDDRFRNLRERCGNINIFLTLLNASDDAIEKAKSCRGVSIAVAQIPGMVTSESFFMLGMVVTKMALKEFQTPVILLELDSVYPEGIDKVFAFMSKQPISYVENVNELFPALRFDGGCMALSPCDDAMSYLDTLTDYCSEILARNGPIYLFDQVARFRTHIRGAEKGWKMTDINEHTNGKFRYFFKDNTDYSFSLEERRKTRTNNNITFTGMTEDRRCIWVRKPQEGKEPE
ncbi:MAG: hypothetical protein LBQ58_08640 [Synergistaceae bacterium]|jgi:hypothetical protein|nr:hypothetical protein [Synergistaceae bacterium]